MSSTLPRFSPKRLREMADGTRNRDGSKKITVAEIQAKQSAMSKKVADALFGKRPKKPSVKSDRKKWKDEADKWFSEFIRLRDSGPDGRVTCITCSHRDHWRYLQNGHFVTRGYEATRFDEENCHAQCRGCNYNGGQHLKHATAIERLHGPGTANKLQDKGARECRRTLSDYQFLADTYKRRVIRIKELEPQRYNSPSKAA